MSGPKGGKPPWINPERAQGVALRDGDIWISVPAKSGTNWMMNIVHQLLTGGDADFDSIYSVVPWPEFVERPGQPAQEVLDAHRGDAGRPAPRDQVARGAARAAVHQGRHAART